MFKANTESDEPEDLSQKIQDFIKQNVHVLESIKRTHDPQHNSRRAISPTPDENTNSFTPFYKVDDTATQALKKITHKLLNQLKFMIKPSQKVVYACSALLALIAGQPPLTNQQQELLTLQDIQWSQLLSYFNQVALILQSFNKFKDCVRQRKILMVNYKSAKHFLNLAESLDMQSNPQQDTIINNLLSIVPHLLRYIKESYQPSYQKKSKKKAQSMSIYSSAKEPAQERLVQQLEPDQQKEQQFLPTKANPTKTVVKSLVSHHRQTSGSSRATLSPNGSVNSSKRSDLQGRVQIAQDMKVSRLDKILGLRVKKPIVESQVQMQKQKYTPRTQNRSDEKQILLGEISKNHEEIKKLRREELNLKWEVEREVKELSRVVEKERESDDITRYRQAYDHKHEFKNVLRSCNKSPVRCEKFSSTKKSDGAKENKSMLIHEYISQKQNEQLVIDLKNELLNSQRTKEEMQEKLLKTIYNCYSKQCPEQNDTYSDK